MILPGNTKWPAEAKGGGMIFAGSKAQAFLSLGERLARPIRDLAVLMVGGRPFLVWRGWSWCVFGEADDVIAYLWGRDVTRYRIYVRGKRVRVEIGDLGEVKKILLEALGESVSGHGVHEPDLCSPAD